MNVNWGLLENIESNRKGLWSHVLHGVNEVFLSSGYFLDLQVIILIKDGYSKL